MPDDVDGGDGKEEEELVGKGVEAGDRGEHGDRGDAGGGVSGVAETDKCSPFLCGRTHVFDPSTTLRQNGRSRDSEWYSFHTPSTSSSGVGGGAMCKRRGLAPLLA